MGGLQGIVKDCMRLQAVYGITCSAWHCTTLYRDPSRFYRDFLEIAWNCMRLHKIAETKCTPDCRSN